MNDREEWGPWIDHDGKGCPVPRGVLVRVVTEGQFGRFYGPTLYANTAGRSWDWNNWGEWSDDGLIFRRVVRYQVKRPRALQQLREMIETLPSPSRQKEDA